MALAVRRGKGAAKSNSSTDSEEKPITGINYDQISWINRLCADGSLSPSEKHELIMKQYNKVLQPSGSSGKPSVAPTMLSRALAYEGADTKSVTDQATVADDAPSTTLQSRAPTKDDQSLYPRRYRVKRDCCHYDDAEQEEAEVQKQHDIAYHVRMLHHEKYDSDGLRNMKDAMRVLLEKACKMPFERTAEENSLIYKALQKFEFLVSELNGTLLRELSVFAFIEEWKEGEVTIFGNTGLHIVLYGNVIPMSAPFVRRLAQSDEEFLTDWCLTNSVPIRLGRDRGNDETSSQLSHKSSHSLAHSTSTDATSTAKIVPCEPLKAGDIFGTLKRINTEIPLAVRVNNLFPNRLLTGLTAEQKSDKANKKPGCCLLKLNASDYERIVNQIAEKDSEEKLQLLSLKVEYKLFPKQVLAKIASLIRWLRFPEQAVLAQEGVRAPYVAFLKEGSCNVFRQTIARKELPLGKVITRKVQVLIGRIEAGNCASLGDSSYFENEAMNCTIISDTTVVLGVIELEKLQSLDDTTRLLLTQSCQKLFHEVTDEQVQKLYVEQAVKDEWAMAKHAIVMDVINSRGIRPGYGKWA